MVLFKSFLKSQEQKWIILTPCMYIGLWIACGYEIHYALFAEITQASVVNREEWDDEEPNSRRLVSLTYQFKDKSNGELRTNTAVEKIGIIESHEVSEITVQYLSGVVGESRRYSVLYKYFLVLFLGFNILSGGLLWWGYSMFKSDTWASNPRRRA